MSLAEQEIRQAARRCFTAPGLASLAALEALLSPATELLPQCELVLDEANAVLDEEGRQLAEIFRQQGKPVVCAPGCHDCCKQLVLCQPFEASRIRAYLLAHPVKLAAFTRAYARWDKATAPLRHSYLAWAEARYGRGESDQSHALEEDTEPCPFLGGQGYCDIYPVRPYGCRTCIGLDPDCATPGKSRSLHMQFSLYTTHHTARTAVTALLLRRLGLSPRPVPMPQMLADMLAGE